MAGWQKRAFHATVLSTILPVTAFAQTQAQTPLSAIDWLDKPAPLALLPRAPDAPPRARKIDEPSVAISGAAPQIVTRPLNESAPRMVGLVPQAMTGISPDLWSGSENAELNRLINGLPDLEVPAANALLFTILLADATTPAQGEQDVLTRARVEKLMRLGAVDPALSLIEQAGAMSDPALFDLWADLSLLAGTEDTVCGTLARAPHLTRAPGVRIFCSVREGDWPNAALTFGSAKALSLLPRETLDVLDRFLNPDLFEDAAPLPVPRRMDPLTFRLFEAIGEPLPTGPLPRAYAVADLRDLRGWKSQLQAAERLTRAGALPDNRLLGLYTDRKPAASGGIWDRVQAVQRFDVALGTGSADAISKTLPNAWRGMQEAGLEVSFAAAFYDRLSGVELTGTARRIQLEIGLLSPDYEVAAADPEAAGLLGAQGELILAVARGEPAKTPPKDALPRAIYDAFAAPAPRAELLEMAGAARLGEALLLTLEDLHAGARGDSGALRTSISTLRDFGLEDTARRAALQILLLKAPQ